MPAHPSIPGDPPHPELERSHLPEHWTDLPREFFVRSSEEVAHDLIGKILWRNGVGGGRLTEVEAYLPEGDPASHSYRGRTARNVSMFGPPGHIYVYLSYGIHVLLNVVCDREGVGAAVLIRSFEPLGDLSVLARNRKMPADLSDPDAILRGVSCGPGRVGQALGLHLELDGLVYGLQSGLHLLDDSTGLSVGRTTRIGISKGGDMRLRFFAIDNPYVT